MFGDKVNATRKFAEEVDPELASRWEDILKSGIPEEILKEIIKKYPPPQNCPNFDPPKLNEAVKAVVPNTVVARDERIAKRQGKVTAALAATAKAITGLLKQ